MEQHVAQQHVDESKTLAENKNFGFVFLEVLPSTHKNQSNYNNILTMIDICKRSKNTDNDNNTNMYQY
eukprot:355785-Amphidinium_carterae.1